MKLRLGTRGSDLAMTQSRWVASELARSGIETEIVIISTSGDRSTAPSFGAIGPQGVFVREIEQALLDTEIDLAVHSYKDLPTESPAGLIVAAVPPRRDMADWLLYRHDTKRGQTPFSALPANALVGTSSARRQAWLKHSRPDLDLQPLRGNVPTRINRLVSGDYEAIVLAGAGIERLDEATDLLAAPLTDLKRHRLNPEQFVPAPAQGALAVQSRADAKSVLEALAVLDDESTREAVDLERRALRLAEGGCDTAFGAWARPADNGFDLFVMIEREGRIESAKVTGNAEAKLETEAMQRLAPANPGAI